MVCLSFSGEFLQSLKLQKILQVESEGKSTLMQFKITMLFFNQIFVLSTSFAPLCGGKIVTYRYS